MNEQLYGDSPNRCANAVPDTLSIAHALQVQAYTFVQILFVYVMDHKIFHHRCVPMLLNVHVAAKPSATVPNLLHHIATVDSAVQTKLAAIITTKKKDRKLEVQKMDWSLRRLCFSVCPTIPNPCGGPHPC